MEKESGLTASLTRLRLRTWLAIWYALFIVYGSLSPFSGWREPGFDFLDVLSEPLMLTYTGFDATVNVLGYLPFGLLAVLAFHARFGAALSVILGLCLAIGMSACMEYLQMFLPARVSSNMDLLTNSAGALIGSLLALSLVSRTWLLRLLMLWRSGLFNHGKEMDFGLALLMLWMFGQINPSLPLLGNLFISEVARQPFVALPHAPFDWWESCAVTLNLLMLGTLMQTLLRVPRKIVTALPVILSVVALAKFIAAAVLLKSWALLLWINSEAVLGMLFGIALLFAALWLPRKAVMVSGAAVALAYFGIVNFLFADNNPAAAMSIYHWHYGHLLNYNGLAQTIALAFPLLLMLHLWRIR
jgi:VanZ family protein